MGLTPPTGLQLDLVCAIARIEQMAETDGAMQALLIDRLNTCDAPRLRSHLTAETLAWEAQIRDEPQRGPQ